MFSTTILAAVALATGSALAGAAAPAVSAAALNSGVEATSVRSNHSEESESRGEADGRDSGSMSLATSQQNRGQPPGQAKQKAGSRGNSQAGKQQSRGKAPAQAKEQGQSRGEARGQPGQSRSEGNRQDARASSPGRSAAAPANDGASGNRGPGAAESSRASRRPHGLSRAEARERVSSLPPRLRSFTDSDRRNEQLILGAAALGSTRGLSPGDIEVREQDGRLRLTNRRNDVLLDLDERSARDLGAWNLRRLGDQQPRENAPSFCRSGEGHPVWGREWCLEKGFGLGMRDGGIWSRGRVDDVVFRRQSDRDRLDRPDLIDVLGDVIFNRLALHSLSLGYDQPLAGSWVAEPEPNAPRILRVRAGDEVVAEFVDSNRDDRAEVLYVLQPRR